MTSAQSDGPRRLAQQFRRMCAVCGWLVLSGCQNLPRGELAAIEYQEFIPKAASSRIMNEVKMRWEVRDDVGQYCAKTIGMGYLQAKTTPPVACAVWHVESKQCTIFTGPTASHVVLGHEVRHCFEGAFPH
jgi:hypothetical protein